MPLLDMDSGLCCSSSTEILADMLRLFVGLPHEMPISTVPLALLLRTANEMWWTLLVEAVSREERSEVAKGS